MTEEIKLPGDFIQGPTHLFETIVYISKMAESRWLDLRGVKDHGYDLDAEPFSIEISGEEGIVLETALNLVSLFGPPEFKDAIRRIVEKTIASTQELVENRTPEQQEAYEEAFRKMQEEDESTTENLRSMYEIPNDDSEVMH